MPADGSLPAPRPPALPRTVGAAAAYGGVVVSPRPFASDAEVTIHAAREGASVLEIVEGLETGGALNPALRPWVRVTLGDEEIPASRWAAVRPRAGVTVFVEVAPRGGSNALRTILQIAVIALAAFVSTVLGPGGGAAVLSAAINIGGNLLINALVPVKQPDAGRRDPRYSLSGAGNGARPHETVPLVLGRRRIYPPRCANWYTRVSLNKVYLRQMFQPSVGWLERASPRLGQTPLESFDGTTIRWNTRPSDGLSLSYFARTPAEDSLGLPIKSTTDWVTRTAPMEADSLSIDVAFLSGLYRTKDSGRPESRSVIYEFRYGPVGGDPASATPIPFGSSGVITFLDPPAGRRAESWRVGYEWAVTRGEYDVHCRRVSAANTDPSKISDELTWVCLRAFRNEPAVRDADSIPWIELELMATDQLNGVPDNFNFIATSLVRQATADGPGETWIESRNPADLFLAASYPPFSDLDLDEDERDHPALADWRALCAAQGWTCDLAEASELSVGELLQRCAAAGRARPMLDFGALSVLVDWEKAAPRQLFTPRNVGGFRGELLYPDDVHALRLRFANEDKDYEDDTLVVFALDPDGDPYDLDSATVYESLEIRDKTDPDAVELEGARILAERVLRPELFTFDQDLEFLTVREGSRAALMHHVALVGTISARVVERVADIPGDRVGVVLDAGVPMVADHAYDLVWRRGDDAPNQTLALDPEIGRSSTVWFAADIDPEDGPAVGDLVAVTDHTLGLLDVIVDRITPREGLVAQIACRAYAPALQTVGEGAIPAYHTAAGRPATMGSAMVTRGAYDRDVMLNALSRALDDAGEQIEAAVSDGVLTPGEKGYVVPAVQALINARTALQARAVALGLDADAAAVAYQAAADDLDAVLATMTTPVDWDDLSDITEGFDGPDFSAAYEAALTAERNLQSLIAAYVPPESITSAELAFASVVASKVADGALTTAKFAAGLEPVSIVTTVPLTKTTETVFNTTNGKLYRWDGAAYDNTVPTSDLSGLITDAQIDDLAAAKLTGQIATTQITDAAITTAKINAGAITTAKIAADAITANEIAAGAITAGKIAAGAIVAADIAADTITAGQIAAGAISATELAAGAVTTAKLAVGAVTAAEIAAGAVTAGKISVASLDAISANLGTITVDTANIANLAVGSEQIKAGAATRIFNYADDTYFNPPNTPTSPVLLYEDTFTTGLGECVLWLNWEQVSVSAGNALALWCYVDDVFAHDGTNIINFTDYYFGPSVNGTISVSIQLGSLSAGSHTIRVYVYKTLSGSLGVQRVRGTVLNSIR